jgi:hypothetical protein
MSTDRDTTRIVRSWLEVGATALPDRVLDAVLDQLPSTPQRRSWWPAWRFQDMNANMKLAIAAAAVVVVAIAGIYFLPGGGNVAGLGPSPSPTPTPSPIVNFSGSFAPGTTYAIADPCCVGPSRMTFTVPGTGWAAEDPIFVFKYHPGSNDNLAKFGPMLVDNVYTGGCHWSGTALVPPVGPTVDDLATALSAQAGPGAAPPTSVTVGGHPGKKVELQIPEDLDVTTCDSDGDYPIFGRIVSDGGYGAQPYTHGRGQHDTFYIVDVDGTRQVINANYLPTATAADRAELDQIVASIRFETTVPSPAPSPAP